MEVTVRKFVHDMIHMTEGEKLIHYWWLWLIVIAAVGLIYWRISK